MVTKVDEELDPDPDDPDPEDPDPEDPEPVEPDPDRPGAPEPLAEELEAELEPPPLTVCPTWSLTAVTVPLIGAVSVVSATAFWSAVTRLFVLEDLALVLENRRGDRGVACLLWRRCPAPATVIWPSSRWHGLHVGRDRLLLGDTGALRGRERDAETGSGTETVGRDDTEDVARVRRQARHLCRHRLRDQTPRPTLKRSRCP